jgi:hypothetical protein
MNKNLEDDNMIRPIEESIIKHQRVQASVPEKPKNASKIAIKNTTKRCVRGKRRNSKTNRCNKKCPDGYTRNSKRRCVKN